MEYTLEILTAPTIPADWLNKAKHQVRVELTEVYDDDFLRELLEMAYAFVMNRADISGLKTAYRLTLPTFPRRTTTPIYLSRPPLIAVDSIQYRDPEGTLQTLDPTAYNVGDGEISLVSIVDYWPDTKTHDASAVRINYRSGVDSVKAKATIDARAIQAIKLLVAHWYRYREDSLEMRLEKIPHGVDDIIQDLRPGDEMKPPFHLSDKYPYV